MSFYDLFGQKRTDMNQKKPTIASTTSELSDGLRKNNSFMPKYIENVPKLCVWLQLFWVVMQHLSFSQSKLSKRFQFQTIEISNVIVASLDIRFNFSNESKSENSQIWSFMVIFSTPKWSLFHFILQFFSIRCRILKLKFYPETFPKQQKA